MKVFMVSACVLSVLFFFFFFIANYLITSHINESKQCLANTLPTSARSYSITLFTLRVEVGKD